jgi:hypothetical protein
MYKNTFLGDLCFFSEITTRTPSRWTCEIFQKYLQEHLPAGLVKIFRNIYKNTFPGDL